MIDSQYISLTTLSIRLGLPADYLRELVLLGKIPCLVVGGRPKFDEDAVRGALTALAEPKMEGRVNVDNT